MSNQYVRLQEITDRVVAALAQGTAPWRKPWQGESPAVWSAPRNVRGTRYRGANTLVLALTAHAKGFTSPYWATYRQWAEQGAQVRRGEKACPVYFWARTVIKDRKTGEDTEILLARTYSVFSADQVDGAPERFTPAPPAPAEVDETGRVPEADAALHGYFARAGVTFEEKSGDRAFYQPGSHRIVVPLFRQFPAAGEYYSTVAHEAAHSTGHSSLLDRPSLTGTAGYGSDPYAREELVAEFAAAIVTGALGVASPEADANTVSYLKGWASRIAADPALLYQSASAAQKAADLILGEGADPDATEA